MNQFLIDVWEFHPVWAKFLYTVLLCLIVLVVKEIPKHFKNGDKYCLLFIVSLPLIFCLAFSSLLFREMPPYMYKQVTAYMEKYPLVVPFTKERFELRNGKLLEGDYFLIIDHIRTIYPQGSQEKINFKNSLNDSTK